MQGTKRSIPHRYSPEEVIDTDTRELSKTGRELQELEIKVRRVPKFPKFKKVAI
jgi:hypothetical protein